MTTPTGSTVDISLDPPTATFGIQLDKTDPPDKLDYPEKAKWALGLRASDPYAEFSSEAWFADTIGDEFYLYGNGKELSKGSITTKAPRYFLNVLLNNLLPTSLQEGLVDVYWEVVRKASGQRSRSTTEKYLVKKTRPAGIDRRPDIFGHDGLRVVAEGFSADADIDASTAANGMWALVDKYQNARENDEIFVYLDGIATKRRLSAAEAAGAGPYRVFIPSAVFQRISQSGTVALICTVIDVAGNIPEGNDKFSPPYLLSSNLDPTLFDPLLFYVNGLESTLLDLGTQSNLPLSVLAIPPRSVAIASPPNQIVVMLTLIKADGTQTIKRLAPFSHTQRAGNQTPVPNEYFKEEGFVRMSFELFTPTGALLGRSGSSTVRMVGTPALRLTAPSFNNRPGPQTIAPNDYAGGAIVAVAYQGMTPAHAINLKWPFANGTFASIPAQAGVIGGLVFFAISSSIIAQSAGQVIRLNYEVTSGLKRTGSDFQVLTFQAQAGGVAATVAVGVGPHAISITNDGLRAFVTCRDSNSISVIDIKTRSVINTIFGVPMAFDSVLSPDNKRLYVSNFGSRSYTVIDTSTYQTIMTVQIAGGDDVSGLAMSADGLRLFVACTRNALVSVHDTATGTSINRIAVTRDPVAMAINREQTQVFISSYLEVGIVNASGRSGLVGRIPGTNRPVQMVFGPDSGAASRVYVTDVDNILVIDPAKNVVIKKIPGVRYAWGAALNPNARELWVGSVGPGGLAAYRDSVFVINVDTDQIIRRLTGFENAASIAFVPNTRLALIANQASNTVSFIPT
ncbi:YncE family protein [Pseudomonas sp. O62]|nr:hypothetical protein [Pseudomonas sp. YeP6b]UXZ20549.1 hypothetical protein KZH41_18670 [Pseudomonas sp. YeP6b]